jgi:hypothetical protein
VYAWVSTLEGPPELMDEGLRQAREVVLPQGRQMEGFKGMIALGDRHSGETLGITFWGLELLITLGIPFNDLAQR